MVLINVLHLYNENPLDALNRLSNAEPGELFPIPFINLPSNTAPPIQSFL